MKFLALGLLLSLNVFADDVNVLVMDSPIHYNHSLLKEFQPQNGAVILDTGKVYEAPEKISKELYENFEHGTHVAGIVAQRLDSFSKNKVKIHNAIHLLAPEEESNDTAEIDYDNLDLDELEMTPELMFKEFVKSVKKDVEAVQKMIDERGIRVVNMSWGEDLFGMILTSLLSAENYEEMTGNEMMEIINKHIRVYKKEYSQLFFDNRNVLFTIAAGNSSRNMDRKFLFKRNYKNMLLIKAFLNRTKNIPNLDEAFSDLILNNVIVVGALNKHTNTIADFSNTGKKSVHILASGVNVNSSLPNRSWGDLSGTSMAAPQVAGVATRMLQINPELTPGEIKAILMKTSTFRLIWSNRVKSSGAMNSVLALEKAEASKDD